MPDFAYNTMPWYGNAAKITELVISEGIQTVGRCAFYGFNLISKVTLPDSLTVIGEYAFFGCSAIRKISIPKNLFTIGAYAFRKSGVTVFDFAAKKGWTADGNEVDITVAANLTSTYYKMTFTRMVIDVDTDEIVAGGKRFRLTADGDSYEVLGLNGYLGSTLLVYGTLNGKPVTAIAPEAFKDCASFTALIIEAGITTIGDEAFANCTALKTVIISETVTVIGNSAFNASPNAVFFFESSYADIDVSLGDGNDSIKEETAFFYSAEEPEWEGNFWRYVFGVPTPWDFSEDEPDVPDEPDLPVIDIGDPNLTQINWDGKEFTVLTYQDRAEGMSFNVVDLTVKDGADLSTNINKAVYERNILIEQYFNAKVVRSEEASPYYNNIMANTLAYGSEYSAYMMKMQSAITQAISGDLLDLNSEVDYINLQESWWDTSAIGSLAVWNKAYFALGDINTVDDDATWCVLFNKYIREKYPNMPNFYEMVLDGEWTVENLNYWAKKAVIEDNESYSQKWELDSDYQFGLYFQNECATVLLQASGITPFINKTNGSLSSNLCSTNIQNALDNIRNNIMLDNAVNNAWACNINDIMYGGGDVWSDIARGGFKADKALFYMCHAGTVHLIRDMEHDFGILPIPKLSEEQENYGNTVQYGNATCYAIPYNTPDPDFSGFMLEALCYYSSRSYSTVDSLKIAYYETLLQRRGFRDDDSWDMLDLVFGNRIFDIACARNTGSINSLVVQSTKNGDAWHTLMAAWGNSITSEINEDVARLMSR